jgi:hypothetical protein
MVLVIGDRAMRRKPLRDLTDEELRLAISQKMGLRFLMPLAVERLEADPLVTGDMYEGALLGVVLREAPTADLDEKHLLLAPMKRSP